MTILNIIAEHLADATDDGVIILTVEQAAAILKEFEEAVDEGYDQGFDEGYSEGTNDAYNGGFDEGYAEGYDQGYEEGSAGQDHQR